MKNSKFKFLVKFSLNKKINTKWFKIVNIFLCLLLIFLVNMDYVINLFGGDFNKKDTIYVIDKADSFNSFQNYFDALAKNLDFKDYEIKLDNNILNEKETLEDEIVLIINKDANDYLTGEVVSYEAVSKSTLEVITGSLNSVKSEIVLATSGMSSEEIARLTSPVSIKETVQSKDAQDNETKEQVSALVTTVMVLPFFLLITTMVQMLGAEINDEKTSRGMEVIISSVPAKTHFLAKVISAMSYILIQGVLLLIYAVIAALIRVLFTNADATIGTASFLTDTVKMIGNAGVFKLLASGGVVLIILFIISFIAYATLSATLASMTTNNEDFQQLQTPLMIIMLIGYYIAIMSVLFDGSIFINILAYVPLLSVLIAPTLYLIGEMSLIGLIATTGITTIATYFLYKYGLRIYKVGILNYSSSKLWRKMFKSLKNK